MSASNKKKLRKAQAADVLTTKQTQEQAEAKKLKIYTISFLTVLALVVSTAIGILAVRAVNNSGIIQKNTIAAHVGDRQLNTVELSYYYVDAINGFYDDWYNSYTTNADAYLKALGLDVTKPLNKQVFDTQTGKTWADHFIDEAIKQAVNDYALYDLAKAENFTLPDNDKTNYENTIATLQLYSAIYGYSNPDKYLRAVYGYGSTLEGYSEYYERSVIANAYATAYADRLTYTAEDRDKYTADKLLNFNSYSYDSIYMSYTFFREGGTADASGNKTYTEAEDEAARKALEEAAKQLATAKDLTELKEKLEALKPAKDNNVTVTENKDVLYTNINGTLAKWLSDSSRKPGDIAAIANETTVKGEDGKETTTINGYYVVIYNGSTDNKTTMANVGQVYFKYEGGKLNSETKEFEYTDEEKANTKKKVEGYLNEFNAGEKTKEALEKLATKLIQEEKAQSGGLVENVNTASGYSDEILKWVLSEDRKEGDTEIIEADNGFYLMFYVEKSDLNYREYMINNEMRAADYQKWYNGVIDAVESSTANLSKMDMGFTIAAG